MLGLVLGLRLGVQADRDDDGLDVGHSGRENEALVIAVDHDHNADDSGGKTPMRVSDTPDRDSDTPVLTYQEFCQTWIWLPFLSGSSTVMPNILLKFCPRALHAVCWVSGVNRTGRTRIILLRRRSLDSSSICRDESLDSRGPAGASKLLRFCLLAANHGNCQQLLKDGSVDLQDLKDLLGCELLSKMGRVSLLPQELASAQEWGCLLGFPAHDAVPLVQTQGQIAVGANPLGVVWVHDGFGGGTHGDRDLLVVSLQSRARVVQRGGRQNQTSRSLSPLQSHR